MNFKHLNDDELIVEAENALRPVNETTDNNKDNRASKRQIRGAAIAGGVAGMLVAGPAVGLVAAAGAAYVATRSGKTAEAARASGELVASTGDRIRGVNEKHRNSDKASTSFVKTSGWLSKKLSSRSSQTKKAEEILTT